MPFMSKKRHKIKECELQGFKYFKTISKIMESLRDIGCQRDRTGNRILHMDQYISLLLLHMFNPICTSLRSLQQASELKKVQKKLGVPRASLGSLSETSTVFDSQRMLEIIGQLGEHPKPGVELDCSCFMPVAVALDIHGHRQRSDMAPSRLDQTSQSSRIAAKTLRTDTERVDSRK
jgi:hypothetical protein